MEKFNEKSQEETYEDLERLYWLIENEYGMCEPILQEIFQIQSEIVLREQIDDRLLH